MMRGTKVLILEDDEKRIELFQRAVAGLGRDFELVVWRDAPGMIAGCEAFFADACLISLDHDLGPVRGANHDPGSGLDIANFLCCFPRVCPVILHSSNSDRVWAMYNELRFAGWLVDRVGPLGDDWIPKLWQPRARWLIDKTCDDPGVYDRPHDHAARMNRALFSLTGLSVGDAFGAAFGERVTRPSRTLRQRLEESAAPPPPWRVTEDTIMALSLVETLDRCGQVHCNLLARAFAERYRSDPHRGYGAATGALLRRIGKGVPWPKAARAAFARTNSMGNGAAVRAAPLGAYFADQPDKLPEQAAWSAEVTHAHPEGRAGAIAVALAAAWAANHYGQLNVASGAELLAFCAEHTPAGETQHGIGRARTLSLGAPVDLAARTLGNGGRATAPDTVPFALWCAARHLDNYAAALWTAVRGLGDCDTNCAMVGGIVILSAGQATLPEAWFKAREPLPLVD